MASSPITSWEVEGKKVAAMTDFISWALKSLWMVTVAMKLRHLLLGRKVMTILVSVLKSRDLTSPTKFHMVKAVIFPVLMYRCESWTIKKAESRRIDAFELWGWRRLLKVPWTARRSKCPIDLNCL